MKLSKKYLVKLITEIINEKKEKVFKIGDKVSFTTEKTQEEKSGTIEKIIKPQESFLIKSGNKKYKISIDNLMNWI